MNNIALRQNDLDKYGISKRGAVTIPSIVKNPAIGELLRVTGLSGCFEHNREITEVTLPDGIDSIGESTFCGCTSLRKVILPRTLNTIEALAFNGCAALKEIRIPNGVTGIGRYAFSECASLERIDLPDSLKIVGDGIFYRCYALTCVTVPPAVAGSIDKMFDSDFIACTVRMPKDQRNTFDNDDCIEEVILTRDAVAKYNIPTTGDVIIPSKVKDKDGRKYKVIGIGTGAFYNCVDIRSVALPDGIVIETGAFMRCSNATVSVPASTISVTDHAFDDVKCVIYHGTLPGAPWGAKALNPNTQLFK